MDKKTHRVNLINKKDKKCFQYAATVTLNHEEIKNDSQRMKNVRPFTNKYNWESINHPSEKDDWKIFDKNNVTIFCILIFCMLKKKKNILFMFQNITQNVKNELFF